MRPAASVILQGRSPSCGVFPVTSGPTMDRSSSPRPCKNRSRLLVPKPHISGSPGENGYIESFNVRLRDELLNGEIFYTLREAQIVIESWRRHYNAIRPHTSLGIPQHQASRFGDVFLSATEVIFETHIELTQPVDRAPPRRVRTRLGTIQNRARVIGKPHPAASITAGQRL